MAILIPILLAFLFLGIGLSLTPQDFSRALKYRRAFLYSTACQYFIFPGTCFAICALLKVPAPISVGIMISAFCPSSTTSNIYTFLFKGDVAFSVGSGAITSIITPITLPILTKWSIMYFYGETHDINIPVLKTMLQALAITAIPLFLGMGLRRMNLMFAIWSKRPFEILSAPVVTFIVVGLIINFREYFQKLEIAIPISLLILSFSLLLGVLGRLIFKLPERMARTISFEVCLQNNSLGAFIAIGPLNKPEIIMGVCTYGVLMIISAYIWGYYLKTKVPINRYKSSAFLGKPA